MVRGGSAAWPEAFVMHTPCSCRGWRMAWSCTRQPGNYHSVHGTLQLPATYAQNGPSPLLHHLLTPAGWAR